MISFRMKLAILLFCLFENCVSIERRCGMQIRNPNTAQGGVVTRLAPWVVSIGYEDNRNNYQHECTGSVLSSISVLTAAHCALTKKKLKIRAGSFNPRLRKAVERNITRMVTHPKYQMNNSGEVYWDVAVFMVDKPFEFSEFIQPVCLPEETHLSSNSIVNYGITVQGWNPPRDEDDLTLTEISVTVRPNDQCNFDYERLVGEIQRRYYLPKGLIASQFCAGSNTNPNTRTSYGDSGGPALFSRWNNGSKYVELLGVVSGGLEYGNPYYTYVPHEDILGWIKKTMTGQADTMQPLPRWSPWSPCSVTCGGGLQRRINDADQTEERECSPQPCPLPRWSPWSPCSVSCGGGVQTRTNDAQSETRECNSKQCDTDGMC